MKPKLAIIGIAWLGALVSCAPHQALAQVTLPAPAARSVSANADGTIRTPADLWTANASAIAAAAAASFADNAVAIGKISGLQTALDARQPLDADLTSIAALSTTSFGRGLLTQADAATARETIGLGADDNVAFGAVDGLSLYSASDLGVANTTIVAPSPSPVTVYLPDDGGTLATTDASSLTSGTLDAARLPASVATTDASSLTSGTLDAARLPASVATTDASSLTSGTLNPRRIPPSAAGGAPLRALLWVGDSLTYGEANGVQVAEPAPLLLSSRLGYPVRNRGLQGWVPRHRVWKLLIDDFPTVLKSDLLDIPPSQYEDRALQPAINNLRTIYADGEQVWVHSEAPSEAASQLYEYVAASTATADGDDVLMPTWVGAGANNPEYLTGRWHKQAGTFVPVANNNAASCDMIVWLGANGMEPEDTVDSLHLLLRNRGPRVGRYWVLTLPNRQYPTADAGTIADWSEWTGAVNDALRLNFPGRVIDVDGFLMGRGDYDNFGNYAPVDADDVADIALGIFPRSLRDAPTGTHFNQTGYSVIAGLVAQRIHEETGVKNMQPVAMPNVIRLWSASGLLTTDVSGRAVALANFGNLDTSTVARPTTGTVGPRVVESRGERVLAFDAGAEIFNDYSTGQSQPNTYALVIKLDALPASRADIIEGDSPTTKEVVGIRDNGGTKEWHLFAGTDVFTGVPATSDGWHVVVAVFAGAASYFYLDGAEYGPFDAGSNSQGGFTVGSTAFPLDFKVVEMVHYRAAADSGWVSAYVSAARSRYSALLAP